MVCNYRFTEKASIDLDEILHYISIELDNSFVASAFMTKLEKIIDEITTFPKCGSLVDNEFIPVKDIRKVPISNYMLYYRYEESEKCVVILRIIYGKRDPQQTAKGIIPNIS